MLKLKIHNAEISTGTHSDFIDAIFQLQAENTPSYICFANVHMIMEAHRDTSFLDVLNSANIAAPDGRPLSLFISNYYRITQPRVCGMDYMPRIMSEAEKRGKSVFFYGCTDEVLSSIVTKSEEEFPNLRIAGTYSPPFRELTAEEDEQVIEMINSSGADFMFVALGCPKQEKWMYEHKDKLTTCMLGVGQAFLVYAGVEKRLPEWMRNWSLEWAYRLYQDPRRLWKRYVTTNSRFLGLVFNEFRRKWGKKIAMKLGRRTPKPVNKHHTSKHDLSKYEKGFDFR